MSCDGTLRQKKKKKKKKKVYDIPNNLTMFSIKKHKTKLLENLD